MKIEDEGCKRLNIRINIKQIRRTLNWYILLINIAKDRN